MKVVIFMGKAQFAQKGEPELVNQLTELIDLYIKEGRIKEKGDILNLLYSDHQAAEERRIAKEFVND